MNPRILMTMLLVLSFAEPGFGQAVSVGVAGIHVKPEELDGALGYECSLQLGPRGAPFEFAGSYLHVQQTLTTGSVRREASMKTWLGGLLLDPPIHSRVRLGIGFGLEVSRVAALATDEITGRTLSMTSADRTLGAFAMLGQVGVQPFISWPLDLSLAFRAETTSFGGRPDDAVWMMSRANGVIGWAVGARYRFSGR